MKRLLLAFFLLIGFSLSSNAFAEEPETIPELQPVITASASVAFGQDIDFSAENSSLLADEEGVPRYIWDFGDNSGFKWGEKVSYKYTRPGQYITRLKIKQGSAVRSVEKVVTVYKKKGLLIGMKDTPHRSILDQASKKGVALEFVLFEKDEKGISGEVEFSKKLSEKLETLKVADFVIFYNESSSAFQAFAQWWQKRDPENKFPLESKLWIQLTNKSFSQVKKLINSVLSPLSLREVIITRTSSLNILFEKNPEIFESEIERRGIDFLVVDGKSKRSFVLLFSRLTDYFIANGISQSILYFLLSVPFIVFIISFFRQFIGISTFGVFAPLVLTLSFILLGLEFGFFVFLLVMAVSYGIRILFRSFDLLYIPKVSLLFSALALSFFFVLGLAMYAGVSIDLSLAIFPMIVMSTVSEKFMSAQSEEGFKGAVVSAVETVVVSFIAYAFIRWDIVENSVLSLPELVLLPVLGNIWLGKFTGLRITEYFKFRSILRGHESQE